MLYKILGFLVWHGAKLFLRRRYGTAMAPKPVLAGALALAAAGVFLAVRRRAGGD
jgi:hypothetical protein